MICVQFPFTREENCYLEEEMATTFGGGQSVDIQFCLHSTTETTHAKLNQISLFWKGLARTNPNSISITT